MANKRQMKKKSRKSKSKGLDEIDTLLQKLEGMPPGPERDKLWNRAVRVFENESRKDPNTKRGAAVKALSESNRKRARAKTAVEPDWSGFEQEIKKQGLDDPFSPEVQAALNRLDRGQQPLQEGPTEGGGMQSSDAQLIELAYDKIKKIHDLKLAHGIPTQEWERGIGFGDTKHENRDFDKEEMHRRTFDQWKKHTEKEVELFPGGPAIPEDQFLQGMENIQDKQMAAGMPLGREVAGVAVGSASLAGGALYGLAEAITKPGTITGKQQEVQQRHKNLADGSLLQNAANDMFDLVEGGAHVIHAMMGNPFSSEDQSLTELAESNAEMGSEAVQMALGDFAALLDDPVQAMKASPLMTLATLWPIGRAATTAMKGLTPAMAAQMGIAPERVAMIGRVAEMHKNILEPLHSKMANISGRRRDSRAVFDAIMSKSGQKFDQINSMAVRMSKVVGNPTRYKEILDELKQALPREEKIAAEMGQLSSRLFGEDMVQGVKRAEIEQLDYKKEWENQLKEAGHDPMDIHEDFEPHQRPLDFGEKRGPEAPPVTEMKGQQMDLTQGIEPLPPGRPDTGSLQAPGDAPPLELTGKRGLPGRQGELAIMTPGAGAPAPNPLGKMQPEAPFPTENPKIPSRDFRGDTSVQQPLPDAPGLSMDGVIYKTGLDEVKLPETRWGLEDETTKLIKQLDLDGGEVNTRLMMPDEAKEAYSAKAAEVLAKVQRVARIERQAAARQSYQLAKPMLTKIADEIKTPFGMGGKVKLSNTAKRYLGEADDVMVPWAFDRHVTLRAWGEDPQVWTLANKLHQDMKQNLTSRNPSSAVGNFMSNLLMQMVHYGTSPIQIMGQGTILLSQYKKFMMGEKISGEFDSFFKRVEERGLMDSTELIDVELGTGAELFAGDPKAAAVGGAVVGATAAGFGLNMDTLGAAGAGALGGPLIQQIMKTTPLKKAIKGMEDFYRFGDNMFKIQHAWQEFQAHKLDLQMLQPGEWKRLPHSQSGTIELRKGEGGRWFIDGEEASLSQAMDAVVDASSQSAFDRFFDYRDSPMVVDWLRKNQFMGLVSPFLTWHFKALDIPGIKKGLVSRTLELPGRSISNNEFIQAASALKGVKQTVFRSTIINGIRHQQTEHRHEFRRALSYSPSAPRAMLLRTTTSPLWIEADDIEQYNWQAPSLSLLRLADGFLNSAPSDEDLEDHLKYLASMDDLRSKGLVPSELVDLTEKQLRQQMKLAKNQFTFGDTLKLIGFSGSIWGEVFGMFQDHADKGMSVNPVRLYNALGAAILGGGISKMLKLTLGITEPGSDPHLISGFTERDSQPDDIQESVVRFSIRSLLGIGYRPMFVGDPGDADEQLLPNNYLVRGIRRHGNILKKSMFGGLDKRTAALTRAQGKEALDLGKQLVGARAKNETGEAYVQRAKVAAYDWWARHGMMPKHQDKINRHQAIIETGKELVDSEIQNWTETMQTIFADYEEAVNGRREGKN